MGLGPPVCLDCMLVMKLNIKIPCWMCPQCMKDAHESDRVSHLFCLTAEQVEECERNYKEIEKYNVNDTLAYNACINCISEMFGLIMCSLTESDQAKRLEGVMSRHWPLMTERERRIITQGVRLMHPVTVSMQAMLPE